MRQSSSYELSLHHLGYAQKNLAELCLPAMSLRVPTTNDNILINSENLSEPKPIVIETLRPGAEFVVRRHDQTPIQVVQADDRRETFGQELFHDPLEYLTLSSNEKFVWHINTDQSNVRDPEMLREFVGILSTFALGKQLKLKNTA